MKHLATSIAALAAAATLSFSASAQAAPEVETFNLLTSTTPPTFGASTITGASWSEVFAPGGGFDRTGIADNAATKFPASADDKYITTTSNNDQYLALDLNTTIGLTGGAFQLAIPIRVDSLKAGANDIDILIVGAPGTFLGIIVDGTTLRLANSNGVGSTRIFSSTAFDSTSLSNWNDGNWRTLLVRFTPAGGGLGAVKGWVLETNGTFTEVFDATGLTNGNVAASGISLLGFGATFDFAVGGTGTGVSIDNVTIYDTADESSFLAAAGSDYTVGSVTDWNLY